jgi:type II secretory pathway component GspD/PulD (secretin)
MMRKSAIPVLAVLFSLCTLASAQSPAVQVTDVAIDKLLEGVRVSIACNGTPNVSSYVSSNPPAVVIDVMDARIKEGRRFESKFYPVSSVTAEPSDKIDGVRVTVRLRELVESSVTTEEGVISVDLGTRPIPKAPMVPDYEVKDQFAGKKMTIYVKDAEIADVLRMIASQFDLNILVTQDVKSVVTVRLSEVPLRLAMDALLKAALCNMIEEASGVIIVKPQRKEMYGEMQTRVYNLDYVEAVDVLKSIVHTMSTSGKAEQGYRRVATGGGSERNSQIVVTDYPEALERVAQMIAQLDRPSTQILIEAKFVEIVLSDEDRFGVNWELKVGASTGEYDPERDFAFPLMFNNMILGKVTLDGINASLELLSTQNRARVLATPQIMTMSDQTAKVSMGTDYPFREVVSDPRTGLVTYSWRTRSIPVELIVTPRVMSDGRISMYVAPNVEQITAYTGSADEQRPIVAKRQAETQITLSDGETAVIGGLVTERETKTVGKIPLLGDIPILGHLFKKTSIKRDRMDMMILITPHIVQAEG